MADWKPSIKRVQIGERGLLQFANALLKEKRFEEATLAAEEFRAENPKSAAGLTTLGICYLSQKRFKAAVDTLQQAVDADPLAPQPVLALGYGHFLLRDYDQAENAFREAINLDPKLPGPGIGLSQVYQKRGEPEKAREILSEVVRAHPQLTSAKLLLAFLHRSVGKHHQATNEVKNLLRPNPGQEGVVSLFPMLFSYQSEETNLDEAQRLLEAAARFRPKNATVHAWLGQVRLQANQFAESEAAFRTALSLNGTKVSAKLGLATSLMRQSRFDECETLLASIPKRRVIAPLLQAAYGDLNYYRGAYAEAVRCFCSALLQLPNGKDVITALEANTAEREIDEGVASQYQKAAERALKRSRRVRKEEEWTALARGFAHAGWNSMKHAETVTA
ncbi:MAG: tetratricopeptide repeat protein [Pseudomonadota bacterium]